MHGEPLPDQSLGSTDMVAAQGWMRRTSYIVAAECALVALAFAPEMLNRTATRVRGGGYIMVVGALLIVTLIVARMIIQRVAYRGDASSRRVASVAMILGTPAVLAGVMWLLWGMKM